MKKVAIILVLVLSSVISYGQEASGKEKKIRELLEVTGAKKQSEQVMKSMISYFQGGKQEVDAKLWEKIIKEINIDEMIELVIPIYNKYYTEEDLDQIIAFYQTAVGKKTVELLPLITAESMEASQVWAVKISEKIGKLVKENRN